MCKVSSAMINPTKEKIVLRETGIDLNVAQNFLVGGVTSKAERLWAREGCTYKYEDYLMGLEIKVSALGHC